MKDKRMEMLKEDEENLVEETEKLQKKVDDDSDEAEEVTGADEDFEDEDTLGKVSAFKNARKEKKEDLDEDEDSNEDSDYELEGGDLAIYDSKLDDVDELVYLRDTLERLNQADASHVAQLLSLLTADES
jgi:hypothetical protein